MNIYIYTYEYIYIYMNIYIILLFTYTIHVSTTHIRFSDPSGSQYRDLMKKNQQVGRRFCRPVGSFLRY